MKEKQRVIGAVLCVCLLLSCFAAGGETLSEAQKASAYSTLYSLSMMKGEYQDALDYAEKSLALDDVLDDAARADLLLKKGYVLIYLERSEEAMACLDQSLALAPNTADAMLLKTQLLIAGGDAEGAFAQAAAYIAAFPDDTSVYYTMGDLFGASGAFEQAARAYTLYLEKTAVPEALAYQLRGQYYLQTGRYQEAEADLTKYLDGAQDGAAHARYLRAIARMQMGDYAGAEADLTLCCDAMDAAQAGEAFDADVLNSFYYRGIARMQLKRYAEAIADFDRCVAEGREADNARFWRGNCYLETAAYESAIADFEHCVSVGTDPDTANYYIGVCRMSMSDYPAAIEAFTVCIDGKFMLAQSLYNRGMCYLQLGDNDKGQADLSASLALE